MGNHPMIFTEIGIPYDMDDKHAYKTGDYSSQISAMDANHFALEGSTANGFTLWLYTTQVRDPLYSKLKRFLEHPMADSCSRTIMNGAITGTARTSRSTPSTTPSCRAVSC